LFIELLAKVVKGTQSDLDMQRDVYQTFHIAAAWVIQNAKFFEGRFRDPIDG